MSLKIKKIHFSVPQMSRPIVNDVDLVIKPGEFVVLLGANGSGKSSLLKCINGINHPQKGGIFLDDAPLPLGNTEKVAPFVSTLTQEIHLSTFADLTVKENCLCSLPQKRGAKLPNDLKSYLAQFNKELPLALRQPASKLSGGQRQCLALAMRLLSASRVLLLDEHTSALDPKIEEEIMALTYRHVCQRPSMMAIMATHNLDHALQYGSRLIVMRHGKLVFEASGEEKQALTKAQLTAFY